jgi:hypothetical protein
MCKITFLIQFLPLDENDIDTITRKIRLRIQVKQCKTNARIVSNFRRDLRLLISKDICSAPCEIHAVTLKCRTRRKINILHTNLDIRMNPNLIFSRAQCNSSCIKCEAESKLQKTVTNLRRLVNSDKFVLSFDGQRYVLDRKDVKGVRTKSRCKKAPRRNGKTFFISLKAVLISQNTLCFVSQPAKNKSIDHDFIF